MKLSSLKLCLTVLFLLLCNCPFLFCQKSTELKNFLWEREFIEMIDSFSEETIILKDEGEIQKRLNRRSYNEVHGLRVQVFAGIDRNNADNLKEKLIQLQIDSVYMDQANGLFKVQIGNFIERLEAEKMLDKLRFHGITNTWIVETIIHVPKMRITLDTSKIEEDISHETSLNYAIQIFVTGDQEKASLIKKNLSDRLNEKIWIKQQGNLWKILVGKFQDEEQARIIMERIRESGFPDAWLTQVND
jgi:hypothetical protein